MKDPSTQGHGTADLPLEDELEAACQDQRRLEDELDDERWAAYSHQWAMAEVGRREIKGLAVPDEIEAPATPPSTPEPEQAF